MLRQRLGLLSAAMLLALQCSVLAAPSAAPKASPKAAPKTGGSKLTQPDPQAMVLHTKRGDIICELYPNAAPKTVKQIKDLVKKHFYDGILFHRVIPNFMIQFGDPNSRTPNRATWGAGGGDVPAIKAEFNELKHVPGTLSMARTSDPDSASCQFFICVGTPSFLDHHYTVFGHVIKGQDIADAISKVPTDTDGHLGAKDAPLTDEKVEKAYLIKHP